MKQKDDFSKERSPDAKKSLGRHSDRGQEMARTLQKEI